VNLAEEAADDIHLSHLPVFPLKTPNLNHKTVDEEETSWWWSLLTLDLGFLVLA
jgi:hypothetical protein